MGIWDYISGTTDSLKRNAPDLTPVKNWCSNSYGYSKAAVNNVSGTVKTNASKVMNHYWPNEETRSKIGPFASSVAKYSAEEGIKFVPGLLPISPQEKKKKKKFLKSSLAGNQIFIFFALFFFFFFAGGGSALKVLKKSYNDAKKSENDQTVDVKALQAKVRSLEKEMDEFKELVKETRLNKAPSSDNSKQHDSVVVGNQKPEDVIRVFMMKDFIGRQFLDDLIVTRPKKN